MNLDRSKLTIAETLSIATISVCVVMILGVSCILLVASTGFYPPDKSVARAAKIMTNKPIISNSSFPLFICFGDIMKFDVKDESGQLVGYVCKGLFKGATPKF